MLCKPRARHGLGVESMLGREADLQGQAAPGLLTIDDDLAVVIKRLTQTGAGVWIVGGAVRDALQGIPSTEVDLAVDIPPKKCSRYLPMLSLPA